MLGIRYVYMYIHNIYRNIYQGTACSARTIFCADRQCAGPGYTCIARNFMAQQFGYVSRTCMDSRYLGAQLHGDGRPGCGAPLARKCTETNLETKTLCTKSPHGSHATTPNIPMILRCNAGDIFCRHCSKSSGPARICTD